MIKVGDTFVIDDVKWVIKMIDLDGSNPTNKSNEPRIDASRLDRDEHGFEKIRRGRPSKFKPALVFGALGEEVPDIVTSCTSGVEAALGAIAAADKVEEDWEESRENKE